MYESQKLKPNNGTEQICKTVILEKFSEIIKENETSHGMDISTKHDSDQSMGILYSKITDFFFF